MSPIWLNRKSPAAAQNDNVILGIAKNAIQFDLSRSLEPIKLSPDQDSDLCREQLWAPWRLAYILANKDAKNSPDQPRQGCFLCDYVAHPEKDAEQFVIARRANAITLLNRFPYNPGHVLVSPLRHVADLIDLTDEELLDTTHAIQAAIRLMSRVMSPHGYNIGLNLGQVAGAGLPGHLHWHLVPRWSGDINFMPVIADVSIIAQSLDALYGLCQADVAANS